MREGAQPCEVNIRFTIKRCVEVNSNTDRICYSEPAVNWENK